MAPELHRLLRGEVIAGTAAVLLLAFMFLLPWYGLSGVAERSAQALGVSTTADGWTALTTLRWVIVIAIAVTLTLVFLQATRPGPALPASFSVISTVLGAVAVLGLIYRVISVPGPSSLVGREIGIYLGLISALVMTGGAFWSLREEDPLDPERAAAIRTVKLSQRS